MYTGNWLYSIDIQLDTCTTTHINVVAKNLKDILNKLSVTKYRNAEIIRLDKKDPIRDWKEIEGEPHYRQIEVY